MNLSNNEYLEQVISSGKILLGMLQALIDEDMAFTITDREKFLFIQYPKNIKVNVKTNDKLPKGNAVTKAIMTKKRESTYYAEEEFGIPVITYGYPLSNPYTKEIVGGMTVSVPIEKKEKILQLSTNVKQFSSELLTSGWMYRCQS